MPTGAVSFLVGIAVGCSGFFSGLGAAGEAALLVRRGAGFFTAGAEAFAAAFSSSKRRHSGIWAEALQD